MPTLPTLSTLPATPTDPLAYYASHSPITDPGSHVWLFDDLPADIPALCAVVQGLVMHFQEGDMYAVTLSPERRREADTRTVAGMLARIQQLDPAPLAVPRSPDKRLVGCCRDFAVLLCAMLRHQRIAARVRFGFSRYFQLDFGCDHVVADYWSVEMKRWVLVDPQMDAKHQEMNHLTFDTHDMPRDRFPLAGEVWQRCRAGQADPARFGYEPAAAGMWVIQSYLVHDLAALNKMELLCWDTWGFAHTTPRRRTPDATLPLLDRAAALTLAGNDAFLALRTLYEANNGLSVPAAITCQGVVSGRSRRVTLP